MVIQVLSYCLDLDILIKALEAEKIWLVRHIFILGGWPDRPSGGSVVVIWIRRVIIQLNNMKLVKRFLFFFFIILSFSLVLWLPIPWVWVWVWVPVGMRGERGGKQLSRNHAIGS